MTNQLTDEQRATLARARAREGQTTPAPWEMFYNQYGKFEGVSGEWRDVVNQYDGALIITNDDADLITDAPDLDDLCRAQADIIAAQAARIATLEAARKPTPRKVWVIANDYGYDGYGEPQEVCETKALAETRIKEQYDGGNRDAVIFEVKFIEANP